jgi:hypothetical protein
VFWAFCQGNASGLGEAAFRLAGRRTCGLRQRAHLSLSATRQSVPFNALNLWLSQSPFISIKKASALHSAEAFHIIRYPTRGIATLRPPAMTVPTSASPFRSLTATSIYWHHGGHAAGKTRGCAVVELCRLVLRLAALSLSAVGFALTVSWSGLRSVIMVVAADL